jgi:hypothetical protein
LIHKKNDEEHTGTAFQQKIFTGVMTWIPALSKVGFRREKKCTVNQPDNACMLSLHS